MKSIAAFLSTLGLAVSLASTAGAADPVVSSPAPAPSASPAQSAEPPLDITNERSRNRTGSAYTLPKGQVSGDLSLLGTGASDMYGSLGIGVGVGAGVQISSNVLHAGVGLINLGAKWNFYEGHGFAFAGSFSPIWGHGKWMWIFNQEEAAIVGNTNIFILPFKLTGTYRAADWLEFDLQAAFIDIEILGKANGSALIFEANLAARQLSVSPRVSFHVHKRLSAFATTRMPLWAEIPGNVTGEVLLAPGVVVGGTTGGKVSPKFKDLYLISAGVRSIVAQDTFLSFVLNYGAAAERLYGSALYPRISLEMRF